MSRRKRKCHGIVEDLLEAAEAQLRDRNDPVLVHDVFSSDVSDEDSIRRLFLDVAGKMPWQGGTSDTPPSLLPGTGSRHTNGRCVETVLRTLGIEHGQQPCAQFLLFMDMNHDMTLHIDPSAKLPKKKANCVEWTTVCDKVDGCQIRVLDVRAGEVVCFMGNHLHGVFNVTPSFSLGLHFLSEGREDEWVVYFVLTGHKRIILFGGLDEVEVHLDQLHIPLSQTMFEGARACKDALVAASADNGTQ
jgi:hypothetical protein